MVKILVILALTTCSCLNSVVVAWTTRTTTTRTTRTSPRFASPASFRVVALASPRRHSFFTLRQAMDADDNMPIDEYEDDLEDEDEISDEELQATMEEWDERIARFNTVHLTGRIGNEAEPRYFDDGKVVLNLSLASKRKYHTLERKALNLQYGDEETDWYGLELWGQTAEFAAKYVDRGCRVGVVGSLQIDQWTDKETGETKSRAKVLVRDLDILESRAEAELRRSGRRGPSFFTDNDDDDDDDKRSSKSSDGGFSGFFDARS